jgi:hypothetical protein
MSDRSRRPEPLVGAQSRTWIGVAAFVVVALGVLLAAHLATRPAQSPLAASRDAQVRLRLELEAKAKEALTTPARNADGTYRVPIEQAMELLVRDNSRFEAFRQAAVKEQAAQR